MTERPGDFRGRGNGPESVVGDPAEGELYAAAKMYWDEDATQAQIAQHLGTSRARVSRLLSQARRQGIVQIKVLPPAHRASGDLADQLREALGLDAVHLSAATTRRLQTDSRVEALGRGLSPALGEALTALNLAPGDIMLVSSGRTLYEVARHELPSMPAVVVVPTLGGTDQSQSWYQTNEIARLFATNIGGRARYLYAPALPGPDLYETLVQDESIQRVLRLWSHARVAVTSVGAPPILREQLPQFIVPAMGSLMEAVGDLSSRFFDRTGAPVAFPGSDRLVAVELATLQATPTVIAVAAGRERVAPLLAGASQGYFNQLVTDPPTAELLIEAHATFPSSRSGHDRERATRPPPETFPL